MRRRASRRVTAAVGATSESVAAEAPAEAPAAEAPAEAPAAEAPKKRATRSRKKVEEPAADGAEAPAAEQATEAPAEAPAEAPKKRATRSRKKVEEPAADAAEAPAAESGAPAADAEAPAADAEAPAAPAKRTRGRRAQAAEATPAEQADSAAGAEQASGAEQAKSEQGAAKADADSDAAAAKQDGAENAEGEKPARTRTRRGRGQKAEQGDAEQGADKSDSSDEGKSQNGRGGQNQGGQNGQGERGQNGKGGEANSRSSRTRQRDRKRRGQNDDLEPEITEEDVLLPIAGILDVLDNYAFVRTSGYLPGASDVYVSLGQVKKYSLRRGDAVVGAIRQPREGEGGGRQKYNAIVKIDTINGRTVEENEKRIDFAEQTPIFPQERLLLESGKDRLVGRAIDLVAPIGFGQRALLVTPAKIDGSSLVVELAQGVAANKPEAHLMLVLADAQPEEVTHLERTVQGEVVAAPFERPAEDQATIAELAIDRAKRLVELGHDVVVLVDSLNRLARAYAQAQHGSARPGLDEVDEFALGQIKKLLASARNLENGGSLTILATIEAKPELDGDALLLREALRVANSEIQLTKGRSAFEPAVKLLHSRTRHADAIVGEGEAAAVAALRGEFAKLDSNAKSLERIAASSSNAALLAEAQRSGARA